MFRKVVVLLIVLCLLSGSIVATASDTLTAVASYIPESGEVIISGTAPAGDMVVVIAPKLSFPENFSDDNLPAAVRQYKVSGSYEVTLGMPLAAASGKYIVYISVGNEETEDNFMHINASTVPEGLIPSVNGANGNTFETIVSGNAEKLGIDTEDEGFTEHQDEIFEIMDKMAFADVYDFYNKYNLAYTISLISGESDFEKIDALLQKYAVNLGINYSEDFAKDKRLTENAQSEFCALLSAYDYAEGVDEDGNVPFRDIFMELKAVAAAKASDNWTELKEVVTDKFEDDFSSVLSDNTKYEKIRDKDAVFEEMMYGTFSSMEQFETVFKNAVTTVYTRENQSGSGGGSGSGGNSGSGGGISGGGGVSVSPSYGTEEPKAEEEKGIGLSDITKEHWAYDAVSALVSDGVISGYEDDTFRPSNYITRAEFVKMILSFASTIPAEKEVSFSDVGKYEWYFSAVNQAASKGIVEGEGNVFRPADYIKRQDAALIVYRVLNLLNKAPGGYRTFADRNDVSSYAEEAVSALGGAYIVNGDENNMFLPHSNITRAETAQLVYNAFKR